MPDRSALNIKSLKEQVYDYLREQMRSGDLVPGSTINLDQTSRKLGVSRTPLRDALLQLEMEGFVTVYPRRGIQVNILSEEVIREFYEIIGALESTAVLLAFPKTGTDQFRTLEDAIKGMETALEADNFDSYYQRNLEFHDVYLEICGNQNLVRIVRTMKKRLYDFPRRKGFVKEWELASIKEHQAFLELFQQGKAAEAAAYIRDVHWSYPVQKNFISQYYLMASYADNELRDDRSP
jgi:DNA-binding GntR family transcriptional regulator